MLEGLKVVVSIMRISDLLLYSCLIFFQSGDDTEELNQDLSGNQNYENGDLDMEVGFEGMYKTCNYKFEFFFQGLIIIILQLFNVM